MGIQVIVTTWGDPTWAERAWEIAIPSAARQADVFHHHEPRACSAGRARNIAVDLCHADDWLCFLDADDELAPRYIAAMAKRIHELHYNRLILYTPALQLPGCEPATYPDRDIITGLNPCPIGTVIHRSLFETTGRFWDEPAWEDWSLFRRAVLHGATIRFVPDAVYVAHSTTDGRNSTVRHPRLLRRQIITSHERFLGRT